MSDIEQRSNIRPHASNDRLDEAIDAFEMVHRTLHATISEHGAMLQKADLEAVERLDKLMRDMHSPIKRLCDLVERSKWVSNSYVMSKNRGDE